MVTTFDTGRRLDPTGPAAAEALAAQLRRWASQGLLSEEQASAIMAAERARVAGQAVPAQRVTVVVELLGYLGGVLVMIGAALLASRFWRDLPTWSRLTVLAVAALALWGAGAAVQERAEPALRRLRGVLWLLSAGAVALFAGVLGADVLGFGGAAVAMLAGLAVAAHSGALWRLRLRPLQQLACLAGVAGAVGGGVAAAGAEGGAAGLCVWALGVLWLGLGWRGLLPPAQVAVAAGAVVALIGAQVAASDWQGAGLLLGLASAAGLLLAGTTTRRLAPAAVGIVGVFMFLPPTVGHFFAGTVGVPLVILVAGVALLTVTLVLLRQPSRPAPPGGPDARPSPQRGPGSGDRPHRA